LTFKLQPDRLASMDTQTINLDTKSILAKLIATENIQVQHNKVKTASFDTKHRVLTLPVFKNQKGDVYDMLIAHECAHALHTPTDGWAKIEDDSLRSYVNVLEDCRIDRIIQKQYPGVIKNYLNGFDILEKQNFFGTQGKDLNKELMLIDKINLFYKSSKRLPISFSSVDNGWLSKVDALKTFDDVVDLAKQLLNWQQKEVEKLKKLPDFDTHAIADNYNLNDDESEDESNGEESSENGQGQEAEDNGEDKKDSEEQTAVNSEAKEGGGKGVAPGVLVSITNENMESKMSSLHDQDKSYSYFTLPKVRLNDMIVSNDKFLNNMRKHILDCTKKYPSDAIYYNWLKNAYKQFKNENKKTVMYLVKEFEMKKAATAYKRASTDKTGTIDPLKLKDYKFSDDIFKRLTITPDAKNHGMIMLLDWSGSMCDSIKQTTEQLMNLVWFCQKVNIPYEVYFFTSEIGESAWDKNRQSKQGGEVFTYKYGDAIMDKCHLVCIANNRMKKTKLDESLMYVWSMALSYDGRYSSGFNRQWEGDNFNCPPEYYLGSTPLNQAIVALNEMIPIFKNKNKIEKMSVITLTDGGANWCFGSTMGDDGKTNIEHGATPVIKIGKKSYTTKDNNRFYRSNEYTGLLLDILRQRHGVSTIGFFVTKKLRTWDMDSYIGDYKNYQDKELKRAKIKSSMTKNRFAQVPQVGYSKYFLLNGKKMAVENTNLNSINDNMKSAGIAKVFKKSMKGRIASRILLNQFIQEVA
jgi:hypothetical protein